MSNPLPLHLSTWFVHSPKWNYLPKSVELIYLIFSISVFPVLAIFLALILFIFLNTMQHNAMILKWQRDLNGMPVKRKQSLQNIWLTGWGSFQNIHIHNWKYFETILVHVHNIVENNLSNYWKWHQRWTFHLILFTRKIPKALGLTGA